MSVQLRARALSTARGQHKCYGRNRADDGRHALTKESLTEALVTYGFEDDTMRLGGSNERRKDEPR